MKPTRIVDVAIIGAGTAGQSAFEQIKKVTDSVIVINDGYWTTTCATVGCMPSKSLISVAERANHAKQSKEFGIGTAQEPNIDGKKVMEHVRSIRNHFTSSAKKLVENWDEDVKIDCKAQLLTDRLIKANNEIIEYRYLIIATGTVPIIPKIFRNKLGNLLYTSDTIFEMAELPAKMAVVGAGPIGIELAQAFNRLGVEVMLLERNSDIAGIKNKTINKKAIDCISSELTMHLNSKVTQVENQAGEAILKFIDADGNEKTWKGDIVLVATGRHHVLEALGIEKLNIELDEDKIPKNINEKTGQVAKSNAFIAGDTSAHAPILHMANYVGKNAGKVIAALLQDKDEPTFDGLTPMSIVFTTPQIANVGKSLERLQDELGEKKLIIGTYDFEKQGRSIIESSNCGLLQIYAHKQNGKILGASMVAPNAEYIAHILANCITNGQTVTDLLDTPFYHPTILEGLRVTLIDILQQMDEDK